MAGKITALLLTALFALPFSARADSEVLPASETQVVVREHPGSKKTYVVITDRLSKGEAPIRVPEGARPDYRMLDHRLKSGEVPYDGPVSSRKKVYVFAAGLAATGIVSSVALPVAAVTGTGAAGGAGAYGAAGGAVAAGTVSTAWLKSRPVQNENFKLDSESRVVNVSPDSAVPPLENSSLKNGESDASSGQ